MIYIDVINEEYLKLLSQKKKKYISYIEILDEQENTIEEIKNSIVSGNINIEYKQGTTRTCSISVIFENDILNSDSYFWVNRKFKIISGFSDGFDTFLFSQGVFVVKDINTNGKLININGIDKFAYFTGELNQGIAQGVYTVSAGTNIKSFIHDTILLSDGRQTVIDCKELLIDSEFYETELPYDISVNAGGNIGSILTETAYVCGADIYYNSQGNLTFSKAVNNYHYAPVQYDFSENDIFSLNLSVDLAKIINQITVSGADENGRIYSYTAQNTNPVSPINIYAVGIKEEAPETSEACYNEERCKEYAEYKLRQKTLISCSAKIDCNIIPHLQANDVISVTCKKMNLDNEKFIVQSVSMPLNTGKMNINACNIQYLNEVI